MSIASRIQEIETHIGNAYTSIDNLGIDISNTNKNIYNISTLLDTFYESLPKVSGIGASLSLSPSMVGKIKLNEIQGDTLQDGTPTPDTPVPIQSVTGLQNVEVCGKNLFDINDGTNVNLNSSINNNEITLTSTGTWAYRKIIVDVKNGENYTIKCLYKNNSGTIKLIVRDSQEDIGGPTSSTNTSGDFSYTFTTRTNQIEIRLYSNFTNTSSASSTTYYNIQLEQGSATTYEPYKGNTYEVNLGKNLLPNLVTTQTKNGVEITKNSDGSLTFNNTATSGINLNINYASGSYIHLESGKKYTISITNNSGIYFRLAKVSDGTLVASFDTPTKQTTFTSSYTGDVFAYLTILNGTSFSNLTIYPQIEVGSQATSYSPYFTPIELNKIGTYEDKIYKQDNKWYIQKNTRKLELAIADMDNSENYPGWRNQTQLKNDYPNKNGNFRDFPISYVSNIVIQPSSSYDAIAGNTTADGVVFLNRSYFGSTYTQTYWKTNYPNLIVLLIYNLQTPTTTEITNTTLINQLESLNNAKSEDGTTNINVTSEDLSMILNVGVLKGDAE